MRIVFLGTPDFAVPSLQALHGAGYQIAGVVCQPDRPCGRGMKCKPGPVRQAAMNLGLETYPIERLRSQAGVDTLRALAPDVMVTAAYGQILSPRILAIPPHGTINVHASLLPKYRGAAPVAWAIRMGESHTGITTMLTDAGVDTGDILLQKRVPIGACETAGELTDRLAQIGARVLLDTLQHLQAGTLTPIPQDAAQATHYPMLTKQDGRIDWTSDARQICNLVCASSPWPGAWTMMDEQCSLKILQACPAQPDDCPGIDCLSGAAPGTVLCADKSGGIVVACGGGAVRVQRLQQQCKRCMDASEFVHGRALSAGQVLL